MKKYSMSTRFLTVEDNNHTDLRTSHAKFLGKGSQYREEDSKIKFCYKRRTVHHR